MISDVMRILASIATKCVQPCAIAALAAVTLANPSAGRAASAPVISQGVARIGADALQAQGLRGAGAKIVILDQAFGAVSRLDSLAGVDLPPLARQHRQTFDPVHGLAGVDYNGNTSRHGEMVAEVVYDVAPDAEYWFVNYDGTDYSSFQKAFDYVLNTVRPNIVVHSNSFLYGPFDGSGFYAKLVDQAAAAGILWVNSAGNYRNRHWEGQFVDQNGDGALDVPGHGDSIPVQLIATDRPACDLSWDGPAQSAANGYAVGLFFDPAGTQPVTNSSGPNAGQPILSQFVAQPDPHADMPPGFIAAPGTYYLRIVKQGNPSTAHLTLYCRFALPADVNVTSSSSPTPGDARGAFSVGAFDATSLLPEEYSSEGPTDDGRPKPDISAPTNVSITATFGASGQSACGGTSCATPHVGGAAALLWPQVAAAGGPGTVAQRVADLLRAQASDAGDPGFDPRFGAGRLRLDLQPPTLGAIAPRAGSLVHGTLKGALALTDAGTLGPYTLTLDGAQLPSALGSDRIVRFSLDTRRLADGPHRLTIAPSDMSLNAASYDVPFTVDNHPPTIAVHAARSALAGAPFRVAVTLADAGVGVLGRARVSFGDGSSAVGARVSHAFRSPGLRSVVITARDRAGNVRRATFHVRVAELGLDVTPRAAWVSLGRRNRVSLQVVHAGSQVLSLSRRLRPGVRRLTLRGLAPGRYRVVAEARGARTTRLLRVP